MRINNPNRGSSCFFILPFFIFLFFPMISTMIRWLFNLFFGYIFSIPEPQTFRNRTKYHVKTSDFLDIYEQILEEESLIDDIVTLLLILVTFIGLISYIVRKIRNLRQRVRQPNPN